MAMIQVSENGQRLEVSGDMTIAEVPSLLRQIGALDQVAHVDLSGVGKVDSSALTVLLACSRTARGTTVMVHHAPRALRALNDLYGLQTRFWVV